MDPLKLQGSRELGEAEPTPYINARKARIKILLVLQKLKYPEY